MQKQTKYTRLTDAELMRIVDERDRSGSDLLQELANRLEVKVEGYTMAPDTNHRVECPICEAALVVEPDPYNQLFDLKRPDKGDSAQ